MQILLFFVLILQIIALIQLIILNYKNLKETREIEKLRKQIELNLEDLAETPAKPIHEGKVEIIENGNR